ncbi:cysteine--tRNA ligase [Aerococcus tenax]|uniref:cysteine--tRNA ligase n=1 Tax=Aerococcus tenax TaxID=3078812 RepID=UPI0018A7D684|nr:cysteine--tRNA ligase [Aerococcus tenax]
MLTVYNTLTKSKEEFHPINEGKVNMYVCGPTVYNYIHIGNARSIVAFDVIRRYLEYRGYEVNFVSNFTDVDDKIIKRSQEEGITSRQVADKYIAAYYEDIDKLNVKRATLNPRVLENIDAIIEFVQDLVDKDYAYVVDGDVYYRARSFSSYGKLSDQSIDDLRSGASERVSADEQGKKEDSVDFALWKAAKAGEPSWESPWGAGRPGWHIECSVMSTRYLADTLDIHGGGADLVFPHHENERAQSEARTGKTFVNYWLHNGFVTMGDDGEKMSKSLGNFVLAHDLLKEVDPTIVRFFLASAQYRAPLKFSHSNLEEAQRNLERLQTAHDNINYRLQDAKESLADDEKELGELQALDEHFIQVMDDDFNVPNALTVIYEALKRINIYMEAPQVSQAVLEAYDQQLSQWLAIIGIEFQDATILDSEVQALIEERDQARLDKDYDRSDAIRQELLDQGIILDDTPQGTRWRRSK